MWIDRNDCSIADVDRIPFEERIEFDYKEEYAKYVLQQHQHSMMTDPHFVEKVLKIMQQLPHL